MINEHDVHDCGETKCIFKCALCDMQCIFPNHFHDEHIAEGDLEKLTY